MPELDQTNDVDEMTDNVFNRRGDAIPRAAVRARVRRNFSAFQGAAVRQFVPVFVERCVRAELRG